MTPAYSALDHQADQPVVRIEAVEGWTDPEPPEAILTRVIAVVCKTWAVTLEDLMGRGRSERLVAPRLAMYALARTATRLTTTELGKAFGRDHGTILYGVKAVANRLETERKFAAAYRAAEARLGIAS